LVCAMAGIANGGKDAGVGETASGVRDEEPADVGRTGCCLPPAAGGPDWTIAGSAKEGGIGFSQTEMSFISVPRNMMYWKTSSFG